MHYFKKQKITPQQNSSFHLINCLYLFCLLDSLLVRIRVEWGFHSGR